MLREQVISPRAGRANSAAKSRPGGAAAQRPAKRANRTATAGRGGSRVYVRVLLPVAGKVLLAALLGVSVFWVYRTVASSSFFAVRAIDVKGTNRASSEQVAIVARRVAMQAGVWQADLDVIRAELERLPWVRAAVVSRVLPSSLRVRITERAPRAVARASSGRLVWVDDDGVLVSQVTPDDEMPAFFLRGWDSHEADSARAENRRRVEKFLGLLREWEAEGLAGRVSEVNLDDLRDVRAQLSGRDAEIEVRLGRENLTKRLRQALEVLDEERTKPRGELINYIDMTRGKSAVLGRDPAAMTQAAGGAR
ncbi:MAG: cell division protein FtsQ/DivIB [Pyrinomonadaceae bacterium]